MSPRVSSRRRAQIDFALKVASHFQEWARPRLKAQFRLAGQQLNKKIRILRAIHFVAHQAFKLQGFNWELRRSGDRQLGLWR